LCGGRLAVDPIQRLIRIDGHPIGITEMEYRVLELLAYARNNVVTRSMLLKHLYRRADDQPQPKIIDVFISKLRKKLRSAAGGPSLSRRSPSVGGSCAIWSRRADSLGSECGASPLPHPATHKVNWSGRLGGGAGCCGLS
jgi:hypothetical protein